MRTMSHHTYVPFFIFQLYDWVLEKSKQVTEHLWKFDPEVDGVRKGKIGMQEFISVLQMEGEKNIPTFNFTMG